MNAVDYILLFPYCLALKIRHYLYDSGRKKSCSYGIPVICVGNVTVGGTGKTPHTEMLIRLLKDEYRLAVISRGYGRRSKGYREVSVDDDFRLTGDEPLQIKRKFPDVTVITDSDRCRAMERLSALPEEVRPTLVLLDDGFQYRKLVPGLNIVLVNSSRPVYEDHLIPFGHLRDLPSRLRKADIVIVTKMKESISAQDRSEWRCRLKLTENQALFFSDIRYDTPVPVFPGSGDTRYTYSKSAVLFTGIADNTPLVRHLVSTFELKHTISFGDHHVFTRANMRTIASLASHYYTSVVLTTEKDAQRIGTGLKVSDALKTRLFCVPIRSVIVTEGDDYGWEAAREVNIASGLESFKKELLCRLLK